MLVFVLSVTGINPAHLQNILHSIHNTYKFVKKFQTKESHFNGKSLKTCIYAIYSDQFFFITFFQFLCLNELNIVSIYLLFFYASKISKNISESGHSKREMYMRKSLWKLLHSEVMAF